jgi:hypothetical protein
MFKFKGDICTERKTYYLMVLKCVNIMKWQQQKKDREREREKHLILYTVVSKINFWSY